MDELNKKNESSSDESSHAKDSSYSENSSRSKDSSFSGNSNHNTDPSFSENSSRNNDSSFSDNFSKLDDYDTAVASTSKQPIQPLQKIVKIEKRKGINKKYHQKKNEIKEMGIKVEEVKAWIKNKTLIPRGPRKDRNYSAPYWKTCMRFLYWADDNTLFEDWYHCIVCEWTHNIILFGGSKVLKNHAESHNIEQKYEFTRQEIIELLSKSSSVGLISITDIEKFLPSPVEWREKGLSEFWKSIVNHSNEGIRPNNSGIDDIKNIQNDDGTEKNSDKSRSKGNIIRAKANAIAEQNLNSANGTLERNSARIETTTSTDTETAIHTDVMENNQKCSSGSKEEMIRAKANAITRRRLNEPDTGETITVLSTEDATAMEINSENVSYTKEGMLKLKKLKSLKVVLKRNNFGKYFFQNFTEKYTFCYHFVNKYSFLLSSSLESELNENTKGDETKIFKNIINKNKESDGIKIKQQQNEQGINANYFLYVF